MFAETMVDIYEEGMSRKLIFEVKYKINFVRIFFTYFLYYCFENENRF